MRGITVSIFRLYAEIWRRTALQEHAVNVGGEVVVVAEAIGFKVKLADTVGGGSPQSGLYNLIPKGALIADSADA